MPPRSDKPDKPLVKRPRGRPKKIHDPAAPLTVKSKQGQPSLVSYVPFRVMCLACLKPLDADAIKFAAKAVRDGADQDTVRCRDCGAHGLIDVDLVVAANDIISMYDIVKRRYSGRPIVERECPGCGARGTGVWWQHHTNGDKCADNGSRVEGSTHKPGPTRIYRCTRCEWTGPGKRRWCPFCRTLETVVRVNPPPPPPELPPLSDPSLLKRKA